MSTVRYEILLPLRYNDGTSVEQEKFMITRRELLARFEGFKQLDIWMTVHPIRIL